MSSVEKKAQSNSAVKADPIVLQQLADHLLDMADERWRGNLWNQLERRSVPAPWLNRLLKDAIPAPYRKQVLQEALQMSWSEDRDFHIPEYFAALPQIATMARRIAA
jgi:hypothetical protein